MARLLIQNGRVIDPSQQLDRVTNLLIENGRIAGFDAVPNRQDEIINATGRLVIPGLIDVGTQLREPGWEEDETIGTGTEAAVCGGYTSIACIPNTDPPIDSQAGVEFVRQQAALANNCNVHVLACVSKNREGKELAEMGTLAEAGAVGFTDATAPIHNAELMRRAIEYSLMLNRPILNRVESIDLSHGGIMHEGLVSTVLGLAGLPTEAEDVMTARDIHLADACQGHVHLMDVSTAGSIEQVRRAKQRGIRVTVGVCVHNLDDSMTDEMLRTFDSNCKLFPPLRSKEHIAACVEGLKDGTVDIISAGHAPRAAEKKMRELDQAPFGMSSLETTFALAATILIQKGQLDWPSLIAKFTCNPANLLGLDSKGTLALGSDADVAIIDPDLEWTVDTSQFRSQGQNTPLGERTLCGQAETVIIGGEIRMSERTLGNFRSSSSRPNTVR